MTKKYYYDCSIQALYMHINFGVKFNTEVKLIADLTTDPNDYKIMTPDITKIYVLPESEHIFFQPKEGDIGICEKLLIPIKFNRKDWVHFPTIPRVIKKETYFEIKETLFVKTIYRDGKHFFNPKEEN